MITASFFPEARAVDYAWHEACLPDALGDERALLLQTYACSELPTTRRNPQTLYKSALAGAIKTSCEFAKVNMGETAGGAKPELVSAAAARLLGSEYSTRLAMLEGKYGIETGARTNLLQGTLYGGPIHRLGEELCSMPVQRNAFLGNLATKTAAQVHELVAAVPIKKKGGQIPIMDTARDIVHEILPGQIAREAEVTAQAYEAWARLSWFGRLRSRGLTGWQQSLAELSLR